MLVAPDVHQIRSDYHGIYTAVYLITGDELTLIDSGESASWLEDILPYLKQIGRNPEEIARIIHTHGHDDHVHGDLQVRAASGARIVICARGARFLKEPGSRAAAEEQIYDGYLSAAEREAIAAGTDYNGPPRREEPIEADEVYGQGNLLEAAPLLLRAIHSPGHTEDSFCLHEERRGLLFSGDAVNGEGTSFDDLPVFQDLEALARTMARLRGLDFHRLLTAHPYLPFRESVLGRGRALELMRRTVEVNLKIASSVRELLAEAGRPLNTAEVSAAICAEFGPNRPPLRPHGTVRLHLVRLLRKGRVAATRANGHVWWRLRGEAGA